MPMSSSSITAILQGYGIPTNTFGTFINQAIQNKWTAEQLVGEIYGSNEFKQMFPGIYGQEGELILTPGEYLKAREEYQRTARTYGFKLSDGEFGDVVNGHVSQQEFLDRAEAAARIKENKTVYEQFQRLNPNAPKNKQQLFDFVMGLGPSEFYKEWEQTRVLSAAKLSGVNISEGLAKKITKRAPGDLTDEQLGAGFAEIAQQIRTVMPLSQIYKFGITKKDLIELEFGGPNQAKIAEKVQRIAKTEERFQGQRAHAQYGATGQGNQQLGVSYQQNAQVQ